VGALSADSTSTFMEIGQVFFGGSTYFCYEGFVQFDTSTINDTDSVSDAVLSLWGNTDSTTTDFTMQARIHDWGATLATTDHVPGSQLSTKTLLATFNTSGFSTAGYNDFTSNSNFASNVTVTGVTYILVNSDRHMNANTPTGEERLQVKTANTAGTTNDPKLTVTHAAATARHRMLIGVGT
jgi:hypothetical protein